MKKHELDDAWINMQNRLKQEPQSDKWALFSERLQQQEQLQEEPKSPAHQSPTEEDMAVRLSAPSDTEQPAKRSEWLRKHKRWIAGTAAACVLGFTLGTPAGNQVLASLQSQFRMEQVTAVDEQNLRDLFNTIGLTESTINRYGEFSHETKGNFEFYETLEELQAQVDRPLLIPSVFHVEDQQQLRIRTAPSRKMTMKVKVEEINATMRLLGADTVLPLSIDGKKLTLTLGTAVSLSLNPADGHPYYSFTQRPVPSLTVEEGVPVAEALEAVLQFPLIPAELKQELTQSQVLDSGSAPLPVVVPEGYQKHKVANVSMLWKYDPSESRYAAVWTQEGQLYTFSGVFPDQDAFTSMLEEMIGS